MKAKRGDGRDPLKFPLRRQASWRDEPLARCEGSGAVIAGASAAAHERAVVTIKLTLLLLIIGVVLFFFT